MKRCFSFLMVVVLFGCNQPVDLPNIEEQKWQADGLGCDGYRMAHIQQLEKDKYLLKGLNQSDIVQTLGRPDENELYKRNQKFFIYNLTPYRCEHVADESPRQYLSVRFNATGLAKEIIIYTK